MAEEAETLLTAAGFAERLGFADAVGKWVMVV